LRLIINYITKELFEDMERFFNRLGQAGVGLLFGGLVLSRFVFVVDGGERAVIFDRIRGV
jgi:hypothetical protein